MISNFEPFSLTGIVFLIFAAIAVISSLGVVLLRNIFYAAFALTVAFVSVAIIYFLLSAEFIGVIQILIYVGAVLIILAFALMFVRESTINSKNTRLRIMFRELLSFISVLVVLLGFFIFIIQTDWALITGITDAGQLASIEANLVNSVDSIGYILVREYLLAFEIAGLLVVAALIGGIILMRIGIEDTIEEEKGGG